MYVSPMLIEYLGIFDKILPDKLAFGHSGKRFTVRRAAFSNGCGFEPESLSKRGSLIVEVFGLGALLGSFPLLR